MPRGIGPAHAYAVEEADSPNASSGPRAIRRDSSLPLHFQFRHLLTAMIERGEFRSGNALPTERELAEQYGVSLAPVRQAILELVREGLLYRVPGQGTFLRERATIERVSVLSSFSESMRSKGFDVKVRILRQETVLPPPEVREGLATNERRVLRFERLALVQHEPFALLTSFISRRTFPGLSIEPSHGGSLYRALADAFAVVPARAQMVVGVANCTSRQSGILGLLPGSPCLLSEGTSFDSKDVPVEYFRVLYRSDRIRLRLDTRRSAEDVVRLPDNSRAPRVWRKAPTVQRQKAKEVEK
jgi:GntR family transcriptional regulator